jgi:hypothetical protein
VGPRPFEWVLTVLLHVAEALSAALAANVVHMDLKTNNIMIDDAVTFAAGPVPEWCVVVVCEADIFDRWQAVAAGLSATVLPGLRLVIVCYCCYVHVCV